MSTDLSSYRDANDVLQRHTVPEAMRVEQLATEAVKRKQEELRQLVGTRYRDLIDSADAIHSIRESTAQFVQTVERMKEVQEGYNTAKLERLKRQRLGEASGSSNAQFGLATRVKFIMDSSERLWSIMETQQYLDAAHVYLMSALIHARGVEEVADDPKLQQLMQRQWHSVSQFPTQIRSQSQAFLQHECIDDTAAVRTLAAYVHLKPAAASKVRSLFVNARLRAFRKLMETQVERAEEVAPLVCRLLDLLRQSVHQLRLLFGPAQALQKTLQAPFADIKEICNRSFIVTTLNETNNFEAYIRPLIAEAQVSTASLEPLSSAQLDAHVDEFVERCTSQLQLHFDRLFQPIETAEALYGVELSILSNLQQPVEDGLTLQDVWPIFGTSLLEQKSQQLIVRTLHTLNISPAVQAHLQHIKQSHKGSHEANMCEYMWANPRAAAAAEAAAAASGAQGKGAKHADVRAMALTDTCQDICKELDTQLDTFIDDLRFLLQSPFVELLKGKVGDEEEEAEEDEFADGIEGNEEAAEQRRKRRAEEREAKAAVARLQDEWAGTVQRLHDCLQDTTVRVLQDSFAQSLAQHLAQLDSKVLGKWREDREAVNKEKLDITLDQTLFVARMLRALSEQAKVLPALLDSDGVGELLVDARISAGARAQASQSGGMRRRRRKKKASESNGKMDKLRSHFHAVFLQAHESWAQCVALMLGDQLREMLAQDVRHSNAGSSRKDGWPLVSQASSDGEERMPASTSTYVAAMLFEANQEMHRAGVLALEQEVVRRFLVHISDQVLAVYEEAVAAAAATEEDAWDEDLCVQVLFDLQALRQIFWARNYELTTSQGNRGAFVDPSRGSTLAEVSEEDRMWRTRWDALVTSVQSTIDPIDFQFYDSVLRDSVPRYLAGTAVLYGALTSLHGSAFSEAIGQSSHSAGSSARTANWLPLVEQCNRFATLPTGYTDVAADKETSLMGLQGLDEAVAAELEASQLYDERHGGSAGTSSSLSGAGNTRTTHSNYTKTVSFVEKMVSSLAGNDAMERGGGGTGSSSGSSTTSWLGGFLDR